LEPSRCTHPWIDETSGPYTAPERPGFFDGRIREGRFRHNSNLYQVPDEGTPNWPPPTMFYGFRRQPDGTFAEPFFVAFEDANDAIASPFGLSFRMNGDNTATILFTLNDPTAEPSVDFDVDGDDQPDITVGSGFDVYTTTITLGQNTSLGTFLSGPTPGTITRGAFPPTRLGFGTTGPDGIYGTQGNPHLDQGPDGAIRAVWTDDEYDTDMDLPSHDDYHDLAVYVLEGSFPEGPWTKVVLPEPVNTEAEEIQPFFTGEGLLYTRDTEVWYAAYNGPHTADGYATSANWETPVALLRKDLIQDLASAPTHSVIAVGEPTLAQLDDGRIELYFVYGVVRGSDPITGLPDIDLQAGMIPLLPP
ncbi:MAG: hypothetical protein AAFX99_09355, partial [Myxococcota bacterium]